MKKYAISLMIGASLMLPIFAFADHSTAHTIEQLMARITALQAQINILLEGGGGIKNGDVIETSVALRTRSLPTTRSLTIGKTLVGATGTIRCDLVVGASCPMQSDGYRWWYVDWDSSEKPNGWSAEGRGGTFFFNKVSRGGASSIIPQSESAATGSQSPVVAPTTGSQSPANLSGQTIPGISSQSAITSLPEIVSSVTLPSAESLDQSSDPGIIIVALKDSTCVSCKETILGQIALLSENGGLVKKSYIASNSAVFSNLAPGIYTADIFADGYDRIQEDIEIDSGESVTATVFLDSILEDE